MQVLQVHHTDAWWLNTWVVVDRVQGTGEHDVRLHWQGGPFDHRRDGETVVLDTEAGDFGVTVYDASATALTLTTRVGSEAPRAGWLSRIYGQREPAVSMSVELRAPVPLTLISVLGDGVLQRGAGEPGHYVLDTVRGRRRLAISDGFVRSELLEEVVP